jgi:hypothetical protein
VRSYVPLVAERFLVGRGYLDESPNNPAVCDLSQAMGTPFDDLDFTQMKKSSKTPSRKASALFLLVTKSVNDITKRQTSTLSSACVTT